MTRRFLTAVIMMLAVNACPYSHKKTNISHLTDEFIYYGSQALRITAFIGLGGLALTLALWAVHS